MHFPNSAEPWKREREEPPRKGRVKTIERSREFYRQVDTKNTMVSDSTSKSSFQPFAGSPIINNDKEKIA